MQEQLITFETARLAKEKNFFIKGSTTFIRDDHKGTTSFGVYGDRTLDVIEAEYFNTSYLYLYPSQEQLHKWLRDNYQLCIRVNPPYEDDIWSGSVFKIGQYSCLLNIENQRCFEDVMEQGLREALKTLN